jgi:hypothetical protein
MLLALLTIPNLVIGTVVSLVTLAVLIIVKEAYSEQLALLGRGDQAWKTFVNDHPKGDRLYIQSLRSELDVSSVSDRSLWSYFLFWSSIGYHIWNNLKYLFLGKGKLAMTTVDKDSDKERKKRIIAVILVFLFTVLVFLLVFELMKLFKSGSVPTSPAAQPKTSSARRGPAVVAFLSASINLPIINGAAHLSKVFRPASKVPMGVLSRAKRNYSSFIHCSDLLGRKDTLKACPNAGPWVPFIPDQIVQYHFLNTILWDPSDYWIWIKWRPLIEYIIIYISVIKVMIKLKAKQIVLYLVNLLGLGRRVLKGLSGLVDIVLLTVFSLDIDYTVTTYQYSELV